MHSKFSYLKQNYGLGFYLISVLILYFTYKYQLVFKPCCDAISYQNIASHYIQNGLFSNHEFSGLRLYGFPFLLSFFYMVFSIEYANLYYVIFISLGYICLSIIIVKKLKLYIKNYNILHIAFALNIFLFPYLTATLADGMSVLCWMLIFYLILKIIDNNSNKNIIYALMFLCSWNVYNDKT